MCLIPPQDYCDRWDFPPLPALLFHSITFSFILSFFFFIILFSLYHPLLHSFLVCLFFYFCHNLFFQEFIYNYMYYVLFTFLFTNAESRFVYMQETSCVQKVRLLFLLLVLLVSRWANIVFIWTGFPSFVFPWFPSFSYINNLLRWLFNKFSKNDSRKIILLFSYSLLARFYFIFFFRYLFFPFFYYPFSLFSTSSL